MRYDGTDCRWCGEAAIGVIAVDPYDYISGSPVLQPATVCLTCYNRRVISALEWVLHEKSVPKSHYAQ